MKKTALCIGINDYKRNPLRGCVNDAIDWSCALENRGFHVTTLINANACKSRIISETRKIITDAKKGDIVVLTYAGHGTYFPLNINYESAMCLSDHMHGEVMRYTEIASIVGSRDSGVKFLFISDCCHSASATRGDDIDDQNLSIARFTPPTFLSTPAYESSTRHVETATKWAKSKSDLQSLSGADVLMSACLSTEFSWDYVFDGRPNGAFTYFALHTLSKLPPNSTYSAWFKSITPFFLPHPKTPQNPQLLGNRKSVEQIIFA